MIKSLTFGSSMIAQKIMVMVKKLTVQDVGKIYRCKCEGLVSFFTYAPNFYTTKTVQADKEDIYLFYKTNIVEQKHNEVIFYSITKNCYFSILFDFVKKHFKEIK